MATMLRVLDIRLYMAGCRHSGPGPGYKLALASLFVLMELTQISYSEIHSEYKPDSVSGSEDYLLFTRDSYNTSIQENSIGKVFVVPTVKMGIVNDDPDLTIKYKILSGDKENFFKAESEHIGDFVFLNIRTRTSNVNVLNRERTERYSLVVRATFRGRNHRRLRGKPSCVVNVQVLDTNDLDPFFNPPTYSANVPEDTALHQSIVRVNAEDADSGVNGEVYYNILGETDQFSIHPVTGVISLTRHLLYAEKKSHRLTIQARDRGATYSQGPQRVDTASVTVNVVQVNQHDPQIQVQHLPEVIEQSHADIYAIIRIHDTDPGRHGQVANVEIIEGDPEAHFRVRPGSEPNEFNIEVLRLLDREISPNGYNLTLKATDKGLPPRSSYKEVHVRLGDMNDHPPVFNREEYQVRVPESALVNTPLTRLKVSDQDSGRNAEVILKIVAGNRDGQFRINPKTGILYVAKPLDHEYKTRYSLTVSALDQANIGMRKQSSARVKIYVEDVNDNDPVFKEAVKSIYFTENDPAGTRVLRLNAKDADAGENSHISYSIANLNADQLPFSIDHFTGIIKSKKLIDYESDKREYKLRVRASDWGTPYRRQSELKLTIKIKDINDNRPQFEREACVGKVSREMDVGEEIMTLSALDFDAGNMISYRVVSGNADACFGLDPMSGVLTAQCELARVPMKKRILNVTATDGQHFADVMPIEINLVETRGQRGISLNGQNSEFECRSTSVAKKLRNLMALSKKSNAPPLEDEFSASSSRYVANIHGPQFMRLPRSIRVKETVPTGTVVFKVLAKDRDLGFNGDVIYVISGGNPDGVFEVDMIKGDVKVASPLDREKMQDYMLNMTACDQGVPQKCTNIAAHIIVQDENDNPPVFMKSAFSFFFPENTRNGTPVVTLNATDKDSGANGQVTYILETQTEEFSLNSTSGLLVVSRELDRETREFYDLTIRAVDGNPEKPMSSFAMVQVRVLDVNDVAPIFTSREYFVKAREDLPVGTVLGMVDAADPDLYQGGQVTFSIDSGAEDKFYMDKKTGAVKIKSELDYETKQLYNLTVLAIDGGSPSLVSVASFVVEVLDVNENIHPPRFDSFFLEARVPENMPIGSHVTRVTAKDYDQDGSDDSRISYSIKGGDGLNSFSIDESGNIKTLSILDRESKKSYWLTVYAQDHGAVPLFSKLEVFVEVLNVNDNVPLTLFPVYYPEIEENSKPSTHVVTLEAFDEDLDPNLKLVYSIISGDPQSLFSIDADTGVITTTSRKLDRETQPEHVLEVRVSDSGQPPLNSTTRVVVTVIDQNDNSPQFLEHYYKIKIPEMIVEENESLQRDQENTNGTKNDTETNWDQFFENSTWEVFDMDRMSGRPAFRVIASDKDTGLNSELSYSIKTGQAAGRFQIEPSTGTVRTTMSIKAGEKFELLVRCLDGGAPQLSDIARVSVEVMPLASQVENVTQNPPSVGPPQAVQVFESDPIGHLVALVSATDKDGDRLFYDIVSGNEAFDFSISRDKGSVLVARQLDWEQTSSYDLNVSITDGISTSYTQITVTVIDVNEQRPEFSAPEYQVDVNENLLLGTQIIQLKVTDTDEDQMVFYSFHAAQNPSSLNIFKINPTNGAISLKQKLDRERTSQHVITVAVKDHGTPSKKNFARLVINVEDHNDHAPEFLSQLIQTKLYETAEVGSSVVQALAIDTDKGENGRITYSILSGNIGNSFSIDPDLGILRVSRRLDMSVQPEYMLILKASDHGQIPSSSTVPVHILLTMADSAIPRFYQAHYATEVYENQPRGHFIIHVQARSQSSLFYEITGGNEEGMFQINPSTGIIMTKQYLDFETTRLFNLTVQVSNMVSAKATTTVDIHVLDVNDNAPRFESSFFEGNVSETAAIGSLILVNNSSPLVIKATDKDSGLNSLLLYEILEEQAKKFFTIDSSTGAIRTIMSLDFELQAVYEFNVRVSDMGKPRLSAETTAHVRINVQDQNDSPPIFQMKQYNAVLLLPTFANVQLVQVNATDPDVTIKSDLKYSITGGNDAGWFKIDPVTGMVLLVKPNQVGSRSHYILDLMVSDGKFTDKSKLNIIVKKSDNSGLAFSEPRYFTTVLENSTKSDVILVVNVLGSALNENLEFRLLNPTNLFSIGITSGALRTTGKVFDREEKEKYELIVEVRSQERVRQEPRIAHVIVDVTVLDLNDNPPMFVNKPYIAVVSKESNADSQVIKVLAMDRDKGANGAIYYQLVRGNGELFRVSRKSGQITLRQKLDSYRKEYTLTVAAYDGGTPPFSAEIPVHIKVVDKSVPMFTQQSYTANVAENIETFSPIISVDAESPTAGGKLIYTIESGNEEEQFSVDYNAGVVYVTQALDYERKQSHQLTLRATDSTAGGYSETILFIAVQDVNDCAPEFTQDSYTVSVSEALPFGSKILNVEARDQDTGINKEVEYNLRTDYGNASQLFNIDAMSGDIHLKRNLDAERQTFHHLTVIAMDKGSQPKSTETHVWVTVLDSNDNAPEFEEAEYVIHLSDQAHHGQFVGKVRAVDPDRNDHNKLTYSIIGGNEHQIFSINEANGIMSLVNLHKFDSSPTYNLNISVSDGVYSTSAKVTIRLMSANKHNPTFKKSMFEVRFPENSAEGTKVTEVLATDKDGDSIKYLIQSEELQQFFRIDQYTGEIWSEKVFDREETASYEIPITATDQGGRNGFTTVKITITDQNDNPPFFHLSEYKANIHTNLTIGSTVVKVLAEDKDEGKNALMTYSIYEKSESVGIVPQVFEINPNTGQIILKQSAAELENEVFQFFVRVEDNGRLSHHADIPVEIYIMSPLDQPPKFEERDSTYFIEEGSPVGQTITELSAVAGPDSQIRYTIASTQYTGEDALFQIDHTGRVIISNHLDREAQSTHKLTILAETDSSPTLNAYTELTIQVLDENDHAPEFQSNPYHVTVNEAVEAHTSILKVEALDKDFANNGEVRYSFTEDTKKLAHLFSIDPHHGWITTQGNLDFESEEYYILEVIATDNGQMKLSSTAVVKVRVIDYNDNPPVFSQRLYTAAVNEGALPGTIIFQLLTSDADYDARTEPEFFITKGDPLGQFQIKQNGEMYVARGLDRETKAQYRLEVTATDGVFVTNCRVTIEILDDNDSPPYCSKYVYRETISEGAAPGTVLATILVTDADEGPNAKQVFSLNGETSEHFTIDRDDGTLMTTLPLDRETVDHHVILARVQDAGRPEWECVSRVELIVGDINDNKPQWIFENFTANMKEDIGVGTIVTKIHATDKDLGFNRRVSYSFLDSADGHFNVDERTGIVSLAKPLDRESEALYNLSIRAIDSGRPKLSSVSSLLVHILDVNDNPPQFASKYYFASISESVAVDTDVVRVLATSKDIGVNADITYSIIGGNEHRKFKMDSKTGLVSVAKELDHEHAKEYFLTIQARDGGIPPLSNHATVNITIMDANDNPPRFSHPSYSAVVNEASSVKSSVVTVTATDLDEGRNGKVTYQLVHGDRHQQFSIDSDTGLITVAQRLDREMISSYVLEVQAMDHGSPALSSSVLINVDIEDANDNAPVFPEGNYTVYVQEDKPYGHVLLRFSVTDSDDSPNGAPFTWDIRSGNEGGGFRVVQDGSLRTAKKFDHKMQNKYRLQIRVFDNGTPPLYSDSYVTVNIIEESQYPPVITPLDMEIFSYQDDFPGSIIGKIKASDQDPYDVLGYEIIPNFSSSQHIQQSPYLFEIDRRDGTIVALQGLDVGVYNLNVSVSDGKFTSFESARVTVTLVTDDVLDNAVIVRLADVSPEDFILSYRKAFIKIMKNLFNVRSQNVQILGAQLTYGNSRTARNAMEADTGKKNRKYSGRPNLDVLFAIRKSTAIYYSRREVRDSLEAKLSSVAAQLGLKIIEVQKDECTADACSNGVCKDIVVMSDSQVIAVTTDIITLVSPQHHHDTFCQCKNGFAGDTCALILNECAKEPCHSSKVCVPDSSVLGYSCQCPSGFTGELCNVDISTCINTKCNIVNPMTFAGRSYAQYTLKSSVERHLSVSLGIKTRYEVSTIMYAHGLVDYSILEIISGKLQYRFNFGSGEGLVTLNDKLVNDGEWHDVRLERHGNRAEIAVDGKWRVNGAAPGLNDVLNLEQSDIYFGADVIEHQSSASGPEVSRGFVGCLDDIKVDHVPIPLHLDSDSTVAKLKSLANIEFKCGTLAEPGACGSHPCQHGGTCLENSSPTGYTCTCPTRFTGDNCDYDLDPCSTSPCLHGAKCVNLKNDFHCECPTKLSGKRCHYGKYCNPNPCQNKGICEEGLYGPICKCRGFTGEFCTIDINECLHQNPCHNGGTCINSPGGFHCICPSNSTGLYCSDLALVSLVPRKYALTLEEVVGIIASLFIIVIIVCLYVACRKFKVKRHRGNSQNLIQNDLDKEHIMMKQTRGGLQKLNNLDAVSSRDQDLPLLPQRPVSISPSMNETHFNYFDTVRSYGSAADELETLPRLNNDYIQNIQKPVATVAPSMMSDRHMNLKDNYFNSNPSSKCNAKSPTLESPRPGSAGSGCYRAARLRVNLPTEMSCTSDLSMEDDCQRYHWDCSDWANQSALPILSELAPGEIVDNNSWVSESNYGNLGNGHSTLPKPLAEPVDPTRDIETLAEGDNITLGPDPDTNSQTSECESQLGAVYPEDSPSHQTNKSIEELMMINDMNFMDEPESIDIPNMYDYRLHPNSYLPTYHLGISDNDDEGSPMLMNRGPIAHSSPDSQRYAAMGGLQPPVRIPQDPEAGPRKHVPMRGTMLSNNVSSDKLCQLEESDDDNCDTNSQIKKTPSPKVTRV